MIEYTSVLTKTCRFWMFGPNWPYQGEIDILEGVHEQESNALTLHTSTGCSVGQDTSIFSGNVETQNCDVKAEGQADNAGCGIRSKDNKSYGAGFNDNNGGVYATEWTSDAISIWFFPRGAVPDGVTGDNPDPSTWGTPSAKWVKDSCDIDGIFKDLNIIFDTTFCGDWAGNTWSSSSCASKAPTCNDYVRDNPEAFTNAFWTVNALKVYQQGEAPAQPEQPVDQPAPTDAPIEQPAPTDVPIEQPAPTDAPIEQPAPTDAPIEQPAPTDAPIEQPAFTDAPIEQPTSTDVPIEQPAPVESTPSFPVGTSPPLQQNPDGTINIPLGPWGTNGEGGSGGSDDGAEGVPGPDTDGSAPPPAVSSPAGNGGGFNWPGAPQATAAPTDAPPAATFDSGNSTGYPVLPTGSGASDIAEVWETIYTTQVMTVTGHGPAPTDAPVGDGIEPTVTVQQTIYQTVMVTVDGGANTLPTQAHELPIARMARRARGLRKRAVQHNRL